MTNESEHSATRAADNERKPYRKPTLNKGPVLSRITAEDGTSVTADAQA
jgi:hypothetical protein